MRLYRVYWSEAYEGEHNFGIFSTLEKAEEHIAKLKEKYGSGYSVDFDIWTLDEGEF